MHPIGTRVSWPLSFFIKEMERKYLELELGLDPQVPLAHHDEGHDVLDPVGVQVLQLDLIMV